MRRVLLAGVVLLSGGLWAVLGDEPKESATSPLGRKLAKLRTKFESDEKELRKKLADAKEADDKQQINFLLKELSAFAAADAIELAGEGKKEEAGLDAAVFALERLGQFQITGADMDKAVGIVLTHHIDNPKIGPALAVLVENGPTGLQFLQDVSAKALNKEVQALAFYYTALALDGKAGRNEGRGADADAIAQVRAEAVELMEKAVKLAPDAKVGTDTLAKAAAVEMVSLKIAVGRPVPDVEGTDLDGKKVKLSGLKGKVVLLDFWATWCGPCVAMIPHEREMVEKLKGKPFALVSVSADEDRATLTEFLKGEKMPWGHWWDGPKGRIVKTFKVQAFPTLYLIDAEGVLKKKWVGNPGNEALDTAVANLVADAERAKR